MKTKSDAQLLREYVREGKEAAFEEVVTRHTDVVYSAAFRQVGSVDLAGDVAQSVFVDLARKAPSLAGKLADDASLVGWLYRSTRYAALTLSRKEHRRQIRERQVMEQFNAPTEAAPDWERLNPVLDEAMGHLGEGDRDALLLRFFKNQDFRSVGVALGVSDDVAQKRVTRALEKLRALLVRHGVTTTAAALSVALTTNAVQLAPAGLARAISNAAIGGAAMGTGSALHLLTIMATTKLKLGLVALVMTGMATVVVIQHHSNVIAREENQALRQQIAQLQAAANDFSGRPGRGSFAHAPRLPAPQVQPPAEGLQPTNLYARLLKDGKDPRLTVEQVGPYLQANKRNAASLLAAFRATGDRALLQEALQKFPGDPRVDFVAAVNKDLSPEERRQWLDAFKSSAPDNALANHLSALEYFNSGKSDQAVGELIAASGKGQIQDYTKDFVQNAEEAYLAAGYSPAEAKTLSTTGLALPQLGELRQLGETMVNLAASYRQGGDESSAQATLQLAANLGQGYRNTSGEQVASQLVGMAVETMALSAMSPSSSYGDTGRTVQDRINQLTQGRAALSELAQEITPIMETMSDQEWINFNDRLMIFGEEPAMRWLVAKHGGN